MSLASTEAVRPLQKSGKKKSFFSLKLDETVISLTYLDLLLIKYINR